MLEWFRIYKGIKHRYPMKELYTIAGITKQALWSHNKRQQTQIIREELVIGMIKQIRKDHKRMGCRRMYYATTKVSPVGRDVFERIGFSSGFRLQRRRNVMKTTWGQRVEIYPNLIEGKIINGINQVWQSDVFYIKIEGKDYFGVSIEDVYSRKLLALHLSKSLLAKELIKAFKKAIKVRSGTQIQDCIFHSDRGSQYIAKDFKVLIKEKQMKPSMCLLPQENAYVERLQGSIKYEYLFEFELKEKNLARQIVKIRRLYNDYRPHSCLDMMTPKAFEQQVQNMEENSRPEMQIYQWNHELLTKKVIINKKKKVAKKKKVNINNNYLT